MSLLDELTTRDLFALAFLMRGNGTDSYRLADKTIAARNQPTKTVEQIKAEEEKPKSMWTED